jgi:hypothetical protein
MEADERTAAFRAGRELFDAGDYLAAHELFEELWEASEGGDADFFKGLIQAAIALHHFRAGNLEGAARLHAGQRRLLAPFLPHHRGIDLARFLGEMQACLAGLQEGTTPAPSFEPATRPRLDSPGPR